MKRNVIVLGATSAIAQACCRKWVSSETCFWLLGRSESRLRIVAADLEARGARAHARAISGEFASLKQTLDDVLTTAGSVDIFLAAQGSLPDQSEFERNPELLAEFFQVNAVAIMQAALIVSPQFERQQSGQCVIIGSVAGDRGRRGNYIYGAAKASLDTFCEGLRQRLEPATSVILIKPGPTDTPMTAHLDKNAMFTSPEKVAARVDAAINGRRAVVYAPFYWRWIMVVIRLLPRSVVKRLRA